MTKTTLFNERKITDAKHRPTAPHYAILIWRTISVETGWSRDEGGGPEPLTVADYYVFGTGEAASWKAALAQLQLERDPPTFLGTASPPRAARRARPRPAAPPR